MKTHSHHSLFRFKSHEVFFTLRELSSTRYGIFRWYQFRDTWLAIDGRKSIENATMTIGNMLRAWVKAGLIDRMHKGFYRFTHKGQAIKPSEIACALIS